MQAYETLKTFEELNELEQIGKVVEILSQAGFKPSAPIKGRRGKDNIYYYKEGCDGVLGLIRNSPITKNEKDYYLVDYKFYKDVVEYQKKKINTHITHVETKTDIRFLVMRKRTEETEGIHRSLHQQVIFDEFEKRRNEYEKLKNSMTKEEKKNNKPAVDHVSHNVAINLPGLIRVCNNKQNNYNKKKVHYAQVASDGKNFEIPTEIKDEKLREKYESRGYQFLETKVKSKIFSSEKDMYKEIEEIEKDVLGEFRYNPFLDFSETWYVVVFWKLLGVIGEKEVEMYQKEYLIKKYQKCKGTEAGNFLEEIMRRYMYDDYEKIVLKM